MDQLSYSVLYSGYEEEGSFAMVMRGLTQFIINVQHKRIEGTRLGQDLAEARKPRAHQGDAMHSPASVPEMMCRPCLPLFRKLAPTVSIWGCTLEDFYRAPTYHLELLRGDGEEDIRVEGGDAVTYSPTYDIRGLSVLELPASCKMVPRVGTSSLTVVLDDHESDEGPGRRVVNKVKTGDGIVRYLKPRESGRERDFEREVDILARIANAGLNGRLRTSELVGIVVSDDGEEKAIGFLLAWIATSIPEASLGHKDFWHRCELFEQWEEQVTTIVEELHRHDIVWGDVNLCNIVIDSALDAWVIDFGGGHNAEFVDGDKAETKEGDWQGIRKIFKEWLPDRSKKTRVASKD